jgi:hypothetical protein
MPDDTECLYCAFAEIIGTKTKGIIRCGSDGLMKPSFYVVANVPARSIWPTKQVIPDKVCQMVGANFMKSHFLAVPANQF